MRQLGPIGIAVGCCIAIAACSVKHPVLQAPGAADRPPDVTLSLMAHNFDFEPSELHVKQGQTVELHLLATDRTHGFELKPFGVRAELPKDQPVTVRFVANQRGTFTFRCIVFCGLGHLGMNGKFIVE